MSSLDFIHPMDVLEVGSDLGEGSEVHLEVVRPREHDIEVGVGHGEVLADHELLGADELVVDVLQLRRSLVAVVLRHFIGESGVKERSDRGMQFRGNVR